MNKLEEWGTVLVSKMKQWSLREAKECNFLAFYVAWLQSTSQSEEMLEMPTKNGNCQGYLCSGEKHLLTQSKRDGHLQELSFHTERGM